MSSSYEEEEEEEEEEGEIFQPVQAIFLLMLRPGLRWENTSGALVVTQKEGERGGSGFGGGRHEASTSRNMKDLKESGSRSRQKGRKIKLRKTYEDAQKRAISISAHIEKWKEKHKILHKLLAENRLIKGDSNVFQLLQEMKIYQRKAWRVYRRWETSEKDIQRWIQSRLERVGFEFGYSEDSEQERRLLRRLQRRQLSKEEKRLLKLRRFRTYDVQGAPKGYEDINGRYHRVKLLQHNGRDDGDDDLIPNTIALDAAAEDGDMDTWIIGRNSSFPSDKVISKREKEKEKKKKKKKKETNYRRSFMCR
eukprot:jgi/Bigna1/130054/aug1.10_g4762